MQRLEGVAGEAGLPLPADQRQAVDHVRLDLLRRHRIEMMDRDHALAQLFEPVRTVERIAKFGLAEQHDREQRMPARLDVRQRSEERRVGNESVRPFRSRGSPKHLKKKNYRSSISI